MRLSCFVIAFGVACPAFAQDLAPKASPTPMSKQSGGLTVTGASGPPSTALDAPTSTGTGLGVKDKLRVDDGAYAACLMALDNLGVQYVEAEPVLTEADVDCGILRPLTVTNIGSGVAISPPATLRCETTEALALWVTDFVIPASKRLSDRGALNVIENGSGYICRRRNNLPDGKLSEHAFGNAFDVMAFQFEDGSRIAIKPREADGTMEEAFQDAVRASACLNFSTVLGPGSNSTHADHLHLDIIERSSGYRICEQGLAKPD